MGERTKVPPATADDLLVANAHTCCVCHEARQPVEIHHINGDPSDNRPENLAVLCRNCHGLVTGKNSLGRSYSAAEVYQYKERWEAACASEDDDEVAEPDDDLYETKLIRKNAHEFYDFEMEADQELIGSIEAGHCVDVIVCEGVDFEAWRDAEDNEEELEEDERPLPDHYFLATDVLERNFRFTAPKDGTFGVLVINWGKKDVEVTTEIAIWD